MSRGNRTFPRNLDEQRPRPPHLFLQQPRRRVLTFRFQRIRTDQLSEVRRLMRRSRPHWPHFIQLNWNSAPRALPRSFRSREPRADNLHWLHIKRFHHLMPAKPVFTTETQRHGEDRKGGFTL